MNVLVTSSTGLTGRAVVKALAENGASVRAMIHSASHAAEMLALGASETVIASIDDENDLSRAMKDMDEVFYICPTAHPREGEIGCMATEIAGKSGIRRFIYQSVHNSIEPDLPHHRKKLMVEQHLLESSLNYTILRPAAFMQNILGNLDSLRRDHLFAQKFFTSTSAENRINLIDVNDYACIAAKAVTGEDYDFGCFDLCGPNNLSVGEMLSTFSETLKTEIGLHFITDEEFIMMAKRRSMPESMLNTLLAMFRAYNLYGFKGNPLTSTFLLGRTPNTFKDFLSANL